MHSIATIARHDLRLVLADRSAVMWLFFLPVVFATFFGLAMGGGSSPGDAAASLTVVNHDSGELSEVLIADLAGGGLEITELTPEERAIAENIVRTLVIPAEFSAHVLALEKVTLRLEKEPNTSSEAALVAQARITAAIARLLGRLVEAASGLDENTPIPPAIVAERESAEDLVLVDTKFAGRARVAPSGFAQSIPGNTVMFVMLVALTYGAGSVSSERESGKLRRLVTAPVSRREIIAGKIVGRFVIAAMQITVLVLVGVVANRVFGIYIGDHPFQMWVVLLLFGLTVAPLGVALGGWITDPDRAASTGVIITMVMAALGGCWWPLEVVSPSLQKVALIFPTGWAMKALHGLISFGWDLRGVVPELLALAGFAVTFSILAARSLRVD
ncbi:MAG: ABC transporter permease [Thermoanaerobaculales bacterium]